MKPRTTARLTEGVLRSGPVILEPIVPDHADVLFEPLQAPELYTFIPHEAPASKDALRARYVRWAARGSPDGNEVWLNYAVREAASSQYVGTVQATVVVSAKTYIAYETFPPFWRRGFAIASCEGLIRHIFANWSINEVDALVDTRNVGSWRLLERLGFRRVAVIPDADYFKGASSDEYAYTLTRADLDNAGSFPG